MNISWPSVASFERDWAELRRGRLLLKMPHPGKRNSLLRLQLPDGQMLALHAQLRESGDGETLCHFRISLPLRQKLKSVLSPPAL